MPKRTVATRPDDVPLWDALIAELDDPRPHVPLEIPTSFVVPDDAFAEWRALAGGAWDSLDRDVDDAVGALDDVEVNALDVFDELAPRPVVLVTPVALDVETTLVLPVWPTLVDDGVTP
jgi:hypothetical protein